MYYNMQTDKLYDEYAMESSRNKIQKLFHISTQNLDGITLEPRIPSNYLIERGFEENKTKRVSLSTSIQGCLVGLSQNLKGKELFIHIPENNISKLKTPTIQEVPDSKCTNEVWALESVKLKLYKKIKVISAQDNPLHYILNGEKIETYKWDYKYMPIK